LVDKHLSIVYNQSVTETKKDCYALYMTKVLEALSISATLNVTSRKKLLQNCYALKTLKVLETLSVSATQNVTKKSAQEKLLQGKGIEAQGL